MEIRRLLERSSKADEELKEFTAKTDEIIYKIEDISSELQSYQNKLEINPERLEEIENRLDLITKLKRKYGGTIESILAHLSEISNELEILDDIDARIIRLEKDIAAKYGRLSKLAEKLSEKRKKTAANLIKLWKMNWRRFT